MYDDNLYPPNKIFEIGATVFVATHLVLDEDEMCIVKATYHGLKVIKKEAEGVYTGFKPGRVEHVVALPHCVDEVYDRDKNGNPLIPVPRENLLLSQGEVERAWQLLQLQSPGKYRCRKLAAIDLS